MTKKARITATTAVMMAWPTRPASHVISAGHAIPREFLPAPHIPAPEHDPRRAVPQFHMLVATVHRDDFERSVEECGCRIVLHEAQRLHEGGRGIALGDDGRSQQGIHYRVAIVRHVAGALAGPRIGEPRRSGDLAHGAEPVS